jgi:hypothetical protein
MSLADQDLLTLTDHHTSPLFCFAYISVLVLLTAGLNLKCKLTMRRLKSFVLNLTKELMYMCRSRYEADIYTSVVSKLGMLK